MTDNFTENELKIFGCFINPKYPAATRTLKAVAKETQLDESVVLAVFEAFNETLFWPITKAKWSFNLVMFMARFHTKYPHLFEKFHIKQTPLGLIMGPKDMSLEKVESILQGVIDDPNQPEELGHLLKSVLGASAETGGSAAVPWVNGSDEILSFPM